MIKFFERFQLPILFAFWLISLIFISFLSTIFISDFGDRFPYYQNVLIPTSLPNWLWGFGNFDGVHYLRIASEGYLSNYSQAFFPFYPMLIKFVSLLLPLNNQLLSLFCSAIIISISSFIGALYFLYKLFALDYSKKIVIKSLIFLVIFPTAFYFVSIYTESLFLLLTISSIYFFRKEKYILAGTLSSVATLTRIFGIFIPILFFVEFLIMLKKGQIRVGSTKYYEIFSAIFLGFLGLIAYMYYLKVNNNDAFLFLNSQPLFGAGRTSKELIIFPKVIYRYLKIFLSVPIFTLTYLSAFLEFLFTLLPIVFLSLKYRKIRPSYLVFSLGCLILPTLTGTLSSMPRYVLMDFLLIPIVVDSLIKLRKIYILLTVLFFLIQVFLLSLFIRGYWVA